VLYGTYDPLTAGGTFNEKCMPAQTNVLGVKCIGHCLPA